VKKWFKGIVLLVLVALMMQSVTLSVYATNVEQQTDYTEEELNLILQNAGFPNDVMNLLDFNDKRKIVENSGENIEFGSHTVEYYNMTDEGDLEQVEGGIQPMGTIPADDLSIQIIGVVSWHSDYGKTVDVYSIATWTYTDYIHDGHTNDSMGMAISDGWEVWGDQYAGCDVERDWIYTDTDWEYSGNCGGAPSEASFAGYAWSDFRDSCCGGYRYKMRAHFKAVKIDPNASNKVVVNYVHDTTSKSNASYGISIGWANVSVTPITGTIDKRGASDFIGW